MPIVHITLQKGRTRAQKDMLFQRVTAAIHESLGANPQSIRIILEEVDAMDFAVGGVPLALRDQKT